MQNSGEDLLGQSGDQSDRAAFESSHSGSGSGSTLASDSSAGGQVPGATQLPLLFGTTVLASLSDLSPSGSLNAASNATNRNIQLASPQIVALQTRSPDDSGSASQEATIYATLTDQSEVTHSSPLTTDASSEEQSELVIEPTGAAALMELQRQLEDKKEALHRLIEKASEDDEALGGEPGGAKRVDQLPSERARLRRLLSELGQMSQEMRDLNQQLQAAEENYDKQLLDRAALADVVNPEDTLLARVTQLASARQELAEERRRLLHALAELDDRNGQIERQRLELAELKLRLAGETDLLRLQAQLDKEAESASLASKKLALEKEKTAELRQQLKSLLEARKADQCAMEALEVKLAVQARELAGMRQGLADRDSRIGELSEQLSSLSAARWQGDEQLRKQLEAVRDELDAANERLFRMTAARRQDTEQHNRELQAMRAAADAEAEQVARMAEAKQVELCKQLDTVSAELNAANAQVAKLREHMQQSTQQHCKELSSMRAELDAANEHIGKLTEARQLDTEQHSKQLEALRADNSAANGRLVREAELKQTELIERLEACRVELGLANEQIFKMTEVMRLEAEKHSRNIHELRVQLDAAIVRQSSEMHETEQHRNELEAQQAAASAEMEQVRRAAETRLDELSKQVDELKAELIGANAQVARMREHMQQHGKELDSVRADLDAANEQVGKLTEARQLDNEQHSMQLEVVRSDSNAFVKAAELNQLELSKQVEALRTDLAAANEQVKSLKSANLEEKTRMEALQAKERIAKQRERHLCWQLDENSDEISRLKRQLRDLAGASRSATERCDALLKQMQSLQAACLDLKKQLDNQVVSSKELKLQLHQHLDAKDKQLLNLESELKAKVAETNRLSGKAHKLEEQLVLERRSSETVFMKLNAALSRVDELNSRLVSEVALRDGAEQQLQAARCSLSNALTKLAERDATIEALETGTDSVNSSLISSLNRQLDEKSSEIGQLIDQVNALNMETQNRVRAEQSCSPELIETRARVELLLSMIDHWNARIAQHCGTQPDHDDSPSNEQLSIFSNPMTDAQTDRTPLLNAAARLLINRRIVQLEARVQKLADGPANFSENSSPASTGQLVPSQRDISMRERHLDGCIRHLLLHNEPSEADAQIYGSSIRLEH